MCEGQTEMRKCWMLLGREAQGMVRQLKTSLSKAFLPINLMQYRREVWARDRAVSAQFCRKRELNYMGFVKKLVLLP